jgi:hypothetical protein
MLKYRSIFWNIPKIYPLKMSSSKKKLQTKTAEKIHPPYNNDLMGVFICYSREEQPEEKNTKKPKENSTGGTTVGSYASCVVHYTPVCATLYPEGTTEYAQCIAYHCGSA